MGYHFVDPFLYNPKIFFDLMKSWFRRFFRNFA